INIFFSFATDQFKKRFLLGKSRKTRYESLKRLPSLFFFLSSTAGMEVVTTSVSLISLQIPLHPCPPLFLGSLFTPSSMEGEMECTQDKVTDTEAFISVFSFYQNPVIRLKF